jgi:hypothetical protein
MRSAPLAPSTAAAALLRHAFQFSTEQGPLIPRLRRLGALFARDLRVANLTIPDRLDDLDRVVATLNAFCEDPAERRDGRAMPQYGCR